MQYPPISLFPFWRDLRKYQLNFFWRDLSAAISVALLALPQAVAYAFVAGLPPSVGIFAAIFGTIFTATFGASRYLISGPTTVVAILLQTGVSSILFAYYRDATGAARDALAINIVIQIVLLVGFFQIIASLLRLGRLTQFASRSVIIGYMLGIAVTIFVGQLFPLCGLEMPKGYSPLYLKAWLFVSTVSQMSWTPFLIGIASLILIVLLYRISKKIPVPLIVLALAGIFAYFFPLNIKTFESLGPLYNELPRFTLPNFEFKVLIDAVPVAFAIAVISLLEATSVGRYYTRSKEPPYQDNQELFGLGVSNFISSFLGAMPSSGSFTRSALNRELGAKSRFAAVLSGIVLLLFVILLASVVSKIPVAALSALLFYISYSLISVRDLSLCLRATRTDRYVVIITFVASLIFALDVALYIGVILSIVFYLKETSSPVLIEYDFNNVGKLRPIEYEDERLDPRICILQTEGHLFFGAADALQSKVRRVTEDEEIKIVILQLFNVWTIDASICLCIRNIYRYLKSTDRMLMITGVAPSVANVLHKSGVDKEIGRENIFLANEQLPSEPTRDAYAKAKALI